MWFRKTMLVITRIAGLHTFACCPHKGLQVYLSWLCLTYNSTANIVPFFLHTIVQQILTTNIKPFWKYICYIDLMCVFGLQILQFDLKAFTNMVLNLTVLVYCIHLEGLKIVGLYSAMMFIDCLWQPHVITMLNMFFSYDHAGGLRPWLK